MIKLNFDVKEEFHAGINRLSGVLGFESGDGIKVTAAEGERVGVSLKDGNAVIYHKNKAQFFRGIGTLCQHAEEGAFDISEDGSFDCISAMIDVSRGRVPTIASLKSLVDHMAIMGYNMAMLYTEDMIELEGRPYFGYMRGRYTTDDLREIDDYAYEYGIEIIPCIECYGHMAKYLRWPEASAIKDTASVMMAREPKTFEFLDLLISTVSSAFRSKRIHIGMDEAWDMGRGNFLTKHGYVPPFEIFGEFMDELMKIMNKYGLRPMMWSDMYFRISSKSGMAYYDKDIVVSDEVKSRIPENVELVFWHYGEGPECDDYMLKKHNELGRTVIFAGGAWSWTGHFPENNYMMITTRFSINACKNNSVKEAMMTVWSDDGSECDLFASLYSLSYMAELCYNDNPPDEYINERFEACTGASSELFYKMSYYHNDFENRTDYANFHDRFFGKAIFWQDITEGLYDTNLFEKNMSEHYKNTAALYAGKASDEKWGYLYEYAYRTFDYLATKSYIGENLVPAYKSGDKETLKKIAEVLLPELKEKLAAVHRVHRDVWFRGSKSFGWQRVDMRYGGVLARCDTTIRRIEGYLNGEISCLEELEEQRLHKAVMGFQNYNRIVNFD